MDETDPIDGAVVGGTVSFSSTVGSFSLSTTSVETFLSTSPLTATAPTVANLNAVDISTVSGAQNALTVVSDAIDDINGMRAEGGAVQNRLEAALSLGAAIAERWSAAESQIRDADFALETAELTKQNLLDSGRLTVSSLATSTYRSLARLLPS